MSKQNLAIASFLAFAISFVGVAGWKLSQAPRPAMSATTPRPLAANAGPASLEPQTSVPRPRTQPPRDGRDELRRLGEAVERAERRRILPPEGDDLTLEFKLDAYRQSLRAVLEERQEEGFSAGRGMHTDIFLRTASVQRELAAMEPGARQRALNHIRREMGFSEEEISRLEQQDEAREARWQRGFEYMSERRRLLETFESDVLEQELDLLREAYFGHEAPTIEREEKVGFFRYERPRVYGAN